MIEADVTKVLNTIKLYGRADKPIKEKYKVMVDGQDNVHPMNETFFLVGVVDQYNLGTATRTLTTRNTWIEDGVRYGIWHMSQPKAYEVRISIQGGKKKNLRGDGVEDIIETLKLLLDTPRIRREFNHVGYSYQIDPQTINIPLQLNTDQYIRYSFKVVFKTNISYEVEQEVMDEVILNGKFIDDANTVISKYEETVNKDTIINSEGR